MYREDCNDSEDIVELINEFKIVQKNERVVGFLLTDDLKGAFMSENFLSSIDLIIHGTNVIHHSHITDEVTGYGHSFCNKEVRENKN